MIPSTTLMQPANLLLVVTVAVGLITEGYSTNDSVCIGIKPCRCMMLTFSKVKVDCHGRGLEITNVCDICSKLKTVQNLDVGNNNLTYIPESCFETCTELEELYMDSNNLSDITKGAFIGLENLKLLNINNNSLIKDGKLHDPTLFQPLTRLKELHIHTNLNISIKTGTINYLSNVENSFGYLERLYLDGFPNGSFGANFLGFKNLAEIIFTGSPITSLTNNSFKNVPHVRILDISFCNLSTIEASTFEPLKNLRLLNLSHNMALGFPTLRNVSYGLRNSTTIETLDYSKVYKTYGLTTQLNRCDLWYFQNTSLKEIRLNNNRMAFIEINALYYMPSTLENVSVDSNRLSYGPYTFQVGCLTNLKRLNMNKQDYPSQMTAFNDELNITENNIDSSGGCQFEGKSLKRYCLLVKNKPLKPINIRIPTLLKTLSARSSNIRFQPSGVEVPYPLRNSLESFDLSNNIIYQWTDPLVVFGFLKHLNLSNNFCSNITGDFFKNIPNLETFDASYNKIGPILEKDTYGSIFERVKNLKVLNITDNWIEKLPANIFRHLKSLESLDLSYNQLETLDLRLEHMKNLSTLYLRQNKISSLPVELLEQLKKNAEENHRNVSIDLSDNTIDAEDCANFEFLEWVIQHESYFYKIHTYTFCSSGRVRISFREVKVSWFEIRNRCHTYTGIIIMSSVFIIVMIIIIICGILYRHRWPLRYFYYMTKARYNGYTPVKKSESNTTYQYDVFISYSTENYKFVTGEMYNQLNEMGLSMCLHQKDFLPGNDIAGNIVQAVRNSKMTLVVLSPAFLESKWCIYEFNMARMESIYSRDGVNAIFVVMYETVDLSRLSPEMRECVESESYAQYPQDEQNKVYFWKLLKQAILASNDRHII